MRPIDKPSALLEENLNLSEVLGEGPKQSGGWREVIVAAPGITSGLQRIAAELKAHMLWRYSWLAKGKATERLAVSINRRGVLLRAPSKVPGAGSQLLPIENCLLLRRHQARLSTFAVSTRRPFSSTSQV